jgi:hypothetical protein
MKTLAFIIAAVAITFVVVELINVVYGADEGPTYAIDYKLETAPTDPNCLHREDASDPTTTPGHYRGQDALWEKYHAELVYPDGRVGQRVGPYLYVLPPANALYDDYAAGRAPGLVGCE